MRGFFTMGAFHRIAGFIGPHRRAILVRGERHVGIILKLFHQRGLCCLFLLFQFRQRFFQRVDLRHQILGARLILLRLGLPDFLRQRIRRPAPPAPPQMAARRASSSASREEARMSRPRLFIAASKAAWLSRIQAMSCIGHIPASSENQLCRRAGGSASLCHRRDWPARAQDQSRSGRRDLPAQGVGRRRLIRRTLRLLLLLDHATAMIASS